ncbi:hypothetical protein O3P69_008675 [Scylla paramamosain]|uniref:Sulfatase N-terminal domain-containing protein n=1 Tax=Scylla paramamosain TaxID=85552 RepID=A0AAW0SME4_SCYPA
MQPFGLSMQNIQQRPDYYCRCNQKVVNALQELGELDNTCIFYTSDQGYHLELMVPRLPAYRFSNIALNSDLAPTFLDIAARIRSPAHMDWRLLLPVLSSTWIYSTPTCKLNSPEFNRSNGTFVDQLRSRVGFTLTEACLTDDKTLTG